jgi:hypothetical protein
MASTPPSKPTKTEPDYQLAFKRWDTLSELGRSAIQWTGLVLIFYFLYRSLDTLAGRNTFAEIGVKFLGNLTVSRGIITLLTGGGWAYGLAQRSLRRRAIERLAPAKNKVERLLDKGRTSSDLTSRGTTPKAKGKR